MSHVKAGGSVNQHAQSSRKGKRLGLKKAGGQDVKVGHIIIRQHGAKYKPGQGVAMGRDYTIFAMQEGVVNFSRRHGRTVVNVVTA
ncbi:50S ribosomal protein L27 [bacterium]|nr:50S ribosomal protein L27 [bacterium]